MIRDLDDELCDRIKEYAKRQGLGLNDSIKNLIEKALGADKTQKSDKREGFQEFFGEWTDEESNEFEQAIAAFDD